MQQRGALEFVSAMNTLMADDGNDGLANFFIKEFKAGRVYAVEDGIDRNGVDLETYHLATENGRLFPHDIDRMADWERARQSPHRRGVDLLNSKFTITDASNKSREHNLWLRQVEEARQRKELGRQISQESTAPIVHSWPDGHTVRALHKGDDHRRELEMEGLAMNHCIGSDEQPNAGCSYKDAIDHGAISHAYSLRDKEGMPKATFHINDGGGLAEVHGYGDHEHELRPHIPKIVDFLEKNHPEGLIHGYQKHAPEEFKNGTVNPFATEGSDYGDYYQEELEHRELYAPAALTLHDYHDMRYESQHEYLDNEDQEYYAEYYDRYGGPPEVQFDTPNWDDIAKDFAEHTHLDPEGKPKITSPLHEDRLHYLVANFDDGLDEFREALTNREIDESEFYERNYNDHTNEPGVAHPDEAVQGYRNALHILDRFMDPEKNYYKSYWDREQSKHLPAKDYHKIPQQAFRPVGWTPPPAAPVNRQAPVSPQQMAFPVSSWKFAYELPEGYKPWEIGMWGKGYINAEGKVYLWDGSGDIHHDDVIDFVGPGNENYDDREFGSCAYIDKDGAVSGVKDLSFMEIYLKDPRLHEREGNSGDWGSFFGSISSPYEDATPEEIAEELMNARRPFIYDEKNGVTHVGKPGWYHQNVRDKVGIPYYAKGFYEGAIMKCLPTATDEDPYGDVAEWFTKVPHDHERILNEIAAHHGVTPRHHDPDEWKFGSTTPIANKLIWRLGKRGKGLTLADEDGNFAHHTWNVSGGFDGRPFHRDYVERALKGDDSAVQDYFYINEDGTCTAQYIEDLMTVDPRIKLDENANSAWSFS